MEKVMHLDSSLKTVSAFTAPEQFESIRHHIDPAWVAEANKSWLDLALANC
jgi:hypothetical protein